MKTRLFYILLPLVFICSIPAFAQIQKQVLGKIIDSIGNPIQGVTIQLSASGLKDTLQTITDKKGSFGFTVSSSNFLIIASATEFKDFKQQYKFNGSYNIFQLGDIILVPLYKTLNNVEVNVSAIMIKEDTIEYRANLFKVKEDATVEDILKKLPGLEVNKNGHITAQGKPVYKIKVNGKDFFGNDIKMATREMPANIIDKIQVIDDYGELAARTGIKSDEPVKLINLQLKKDKSNGMFGNTAAGYGSSNSYQLKASTNFFSDKSQLSVYGNSNNINNGYIVSGKSNTGSNGIVSGNTTMGGGTAVNADLQHNMNGMPDGITTSLAAGTNYRVDLGNNNSFYGSYNFNNRSTEGLREQYLQYIYPDQVIFNNRTNNYSNRGNSHTAYVNLELYPDSMSYLKINADIFLNNNSNISNTNYSFLSNNFKTSEGYVGDSGKSRSPLLGISILFNRYFKKYGRNISLTLAGNTNRLVTHAERPASTRIFDALGGYTDSLQYQQMFQKNKGYSYSFSLSYTEPIFKDRFIDLTWYYDFSKSNNTRDVYTKQPVSSSFIYNTDLSEQFTNRFFGNNFGLSVRTVKKKYNYTIGINLLPVSTGIDVEKNDSAFKTQKILNFSPLARFSYAIAPSKNITFNYRGINRKPEYLQLIPARDISNQQYQSEGNPNLRSEFTQSVNLSYNSFNPLSGNTLFSALSFSTVQNKIINNTILLDSSGTQLTRPENINGAYGFGAWYSYSKPLQKNKYNIKYTGSLNFNRDAVMVNSKKETGKNVFLSQAVSFTYNNNKWLEFTIEADYTLVSTRNLVQHSNRSDYSSWIFSNTMNMNLPKNFVLKYDFEIILNNGLDASINKNINLLNFSAEKKLLKKKSLYLSLAGVNILNQNFSLNRRINGNSIMDMYAVQLARYFIFTLTYKWNKFGK